MARRGEFPRWKFLLARSDDLAPLGELRHATERRLSIVLNQPGSASLSLPVDDPLAGALSPWETCVIAQKNDRWVWSGPVVSFGSTLPSDRVAVNAVGWFERLNHRVVLDLVQYADQDSAQIAFGLLNVANAYGDTFVRPGTSELSQPRTRTYSVDSNVGGEIFALTQIEAGPDIHVDPATRALNVYARRGIDRPEAVFGYRWGPRNLASFTEDVDGAVMANDVRARGKFGTGFADDARSKDTYGVLQDSPALNDVPDTNVLIAYANADIVYRRDPRVSYRFAPKPVGTASVPSLFEDFDIGDTVYASADRGRVQARGQAVRVFGAEVTIDNDGTERVGELQTAAT